jgi:GTP-binding protein
VPRQAVLSQENLRSGHEGLGRRPCGGHRERVPPVLKSQEPALPVSAPRPHVAIVGRPNVGKSTLFNRLTGRRTALVSDLPGLTRDRREEEADFRGNAVMLVDTAGLEEAAEGSIPSRMREQSESAIRRADAILFVIDARAGLVPSDKEFARIARSSGKPVILVANKCEGRAAEAGFHEAFALGLGAPVAVSAEHGEGIGDLENEVLGALGLEAKVSPSRRRRRDGVQDDATTPEGGGDAEPAAPAQPIRVAIVGRPNAGKSTLVNTILGEDRMLTGPEPGLTRDSVSTDFAWEGREIRLFDTAGLRRKARISETAEKLAASDAIRAIRFAEVVVLLIEPARALEQQDLVIANRVIEEGRALVIGINKWDAVEDHQKLLRDIRETVSQTFADAAGVSVIPVSALSGRGVDKLMRAVVDAHAVWNRRVGTSALNRWLQDALARHTPPASRGRRIRIRFMTQPSTRPPTFVAFCSQPEGLPKSYIRYLVNSLREAFDLPGTPIRFNLRKGDNPYAKD